MKERAKALKTLDAEGRSAAVAARGERSAATTVDSEPLVRVLPSWRAEDDVLTATFVWTSSEGWTHTSVREQVFDCPPGAPCMAPMREEVTVSWLYGVEVAASFAVNGRGKVVEELWHEPRAMLSVP